MENSENLIMEPIEKEYAYEDFSKMHVWKSAFDFLVKVYKVSKEFPDEEKYGLISDLRRSANSVVHNIAEGFGRFETKDKTRFYKISRGSTFEMISQLLVAKELNYMNGQVNYLITECTNIIRELSALIKSLESNSRALP